MTPLDIKPKYSKKLFDKLLKPLKNETKKIIVFITEHLRKNGTLYPVEITLQRSVFNSKPVYIAFVTDISQRQREEKIREIIYNITKKAHETSDLGVLFKFIQTELSAIINVANFFIALYDKKTDMINTPYMVDELDNDENFPKGKTLTGYIIDSKKTLLVSDTILKTLEKEKKIKILGLDLLQKVGWAYP